MTDFEKITPSEPQSEEPKQEPEKTAEISEAEKLEKRKRYIELAKELAEGGEQFPFPGLDSESKSYAKLKAADEKDPGYTTPIDELIEKFEENGIKVVLGQFPESGNVFILPFNSNNIGEDMVFPKYFQISKGMDERLKELIELDRV